MKKGRLFLLFFIIGLIIIGGSFLIASHQPKIRELGATEAIIWKKKWKISVDDNKLVFSYWTGSGWAVHSELEPPAP